MAGLERWKFYVKAKDLDYIHQKLNGTESQRTPKEVAIELLDSQV